MTDGSRDSQDLENYNGVALFVRAGDGASVPVGPDAPMPMTLNASSGSTEGSRNSEDLERYNGVALFVRGPNGRSVPVGPDNPLPVTGDGLGAVPTPLLGRAYADAVQRLPDGAWTRVVYGAVTDDAGGAMTSAGFTVPAPGVYDISVGVVFFDPANLPSAGDYLNVAVRKNGAEALKIAELTLGAAGPYGAIGAGALRLAAGDVLSVWAYTTPGRTINGGPNSEVTTFTVANWRP
ncbi:hypothetical protein [Deinococcus kurensis]|uniref:hypothetical protein n=1 Tax=Deinococcus kurensis TaxID=2662757 RepID=UPI0012D31657|nr:hypothetical protein [Deinococcus kurensis]